MSAENTTIKISKETKQRLDNLREYKKETYEEVIKKILYILNQIRKDPLSANNLLRNIDKAIRRKKYITKQTKHSASKNSNQQ